MDLIAFSNGGTPTVTGVPTTETIGGLSVSGSTVVTFANAAPTTLTIANGVSGADLSVASGSQLKVLSTSVFLPQNYIMLHRGSDQGVTANMAVVGTDGLVGTVVFASKNMSLVMSLINRESKVIATQNKLKAEQDLERIKVEANSRIAQAKGEAEAISIQAQAIQSNGGANYVQLQWIEKWDGKLPDTVVGADSKTLMNIGK